MAFTLRQLRSLTALAEEGHFGRAAAAVNISQPALSVQIGELEAALNARLVERGRREAVLTPTGREIVSRARRIFEEVREIEQVARWHGGLSGRLRIGVIPTVAPYLLPLALPELRARNISLDLGVREAQTERLIDEVRSGGLDAAVVALPVDAPDLVAAPRFSRIASCWREPRRGWRRSAPTGRRWRRRRWSRGSSCCSTTGTVWPIRRSRRAAWTGAGAPMDLRAASLATLCRLVSEGFGVTLLPELAAAGERAAAPGLALARFAAPEPRRMVGLVRRKLSVDDGWFGELGRILGDAGRQVIAGWGEAEPCGPGNAGSPG